jgi:hypothetical protein
MIEGGLTLLELETLVSEYQAAKRLAREVQQYGWNNLSVWDEVALSGDSSIAKMAFELIRKGSIDSSYFDINRLKEWKSQNPGLSSRNEEIIRKGFSLEEQEMQNIKCNFTEAIAKAIVLKFQIYGSQFDENHFLPQDSELRSMVETFLFPLIGKSKSYESAGQAQWRVSEPNILRAAHFRMSTRVIEGLLEIKEYPGDSIHLTGRTVGIHETIFRKTLNSYNFYQLLEEMRNLLQSYECPEEDLQEFCERLKQFYDSRYDYFNPE